jgi:hypothetical protein
MEKTASKLAADGGVSRKTLPSGGAWWAASSADAHHGKMLR